MEVPIQKEKRPIKEEYIPQGKEFQCESCGKVLKSRKAWKDHIRIHTGEKPHQCPFEGCGKAFIQYSSLQKHLRAHKGEKPYKCQICGKEFSQICNLKRHERLHSGEKPFTCQICSRTFTTSSNLKQHLDTHDETLYRCAVCGKDYHNVRSYKKHMKTHSSDKTQETKQSEPKELLEIVPEKSLLTKRASPIEFIYDPTKQVKSEMPVQPLRVKPIPLIIEGENMMRMESRNREYREQAHFEEEVHMKESSNSFVGTSQFEKKIPGFNPSECLIIRHHDHNDYLFKGKLMHQKENGDWEEHELEASEQNPSICKPLKEMSHIPNFSFLTAQYRSLIEEKKGSVTQEMLSNSCNVLLCGGCNGASQNETGTGCCCSGQSQDKNSEGSGCCSDKSTTNLSQPELQKKKSGGCCSSKVETVAPKKSCCSSPKEEPVAKSSGCCSKKPGEAEQASEGGCCSGKSNKSKSGGCCGDGCKCGTTAKQAQEIKEVGECGDSGFVVRKFSSCLCSETKSFKHRHSELCGHPIIIHDGHIDYIVGNQLHHVHDGHCDDHGVVFIVEKSELRQKEDNNHRLDLELTYTEL